MPVWGFTFSELVAGESAFFLYVPSVQLRHKLKMFDHQITSLFSIFLIRFSLILFPLLPFLDLGWEFGGVSIRRWACRVACGFSISSSWPWVKNSPLITPWRRKSLQLFRMWVSLFYPRCLNQVSVRWAPVGFSLQLTLPSSLKMFFSGDGLFNLVWHNLIMNGLLSDSTISFMALVLHPLASRSFLEEAIELMLCFVCLWGF